MRSGVRWNRTASRGYVTTHGETETCYDAITWNTSVSIIALQKNDLVLVWSATVAASAPSSARRKSDAALGDGRPRIHDDLKDEAIKQNVPGRSRKLCMLSVLMVGGIRIELMTSSVSRKRSPTELTARRNREKCRFFAVLRAGPAARRFDKAFARVIEWRVPLFTRQHGGTMNQNLRNCFPWPSMTDGGSACFGPSEGGPA